MQVAKNRKNCHVNIKSKEVEVRNQVIIKFGENNKVKAQVRAKELLYTTLIKF